jgi:hypothetical protein
MATFFVILFALGCLATFVCGVRKEWLGGRLIAAGVAVLSFLLALLTVSIK